MSAQSRPFTTTGTTQDSGPDTLTDTSTTSWSDSGTDGLDDAEALDRSADVRFVDKDASIGSLAKELLHEVPALLTKELALAKSEMRETLHETKEGLIAVSSGGIVLTGGYVVLLFAAVYGLSLVMAPWLAALIIGAIAAVIGFLMVSAGMRQFRAENLRPDHTLNSVRKDTDVIRGRTS